MMFIAMAVVFSALAGALMGLRLTVLALMPGLAIAVVIVAVAGPLSGQSFWSTLIALVGTIIGLQSGYVSGSVLHFALRLGNERSIASLVVE